MKITTILISLFFLAGCGDDGKDGAQGAKGTAGESSNQSINIIRFTSDTSVCASGSGLLIQVLNPAWLLGGTSIASEAVVCDGLNGKDGEIGATGPQGSEGPQGEEGASAPASPYEVTQVIDPCGDAPGIYDEVFLKMANGTLIASFSDNAAGNNTRLSILVPGSYVTTDGSNCHVTVHNDGTVTW